MNPKKSKAISAEEFMAQLRSNPEFVRKSEERERNRQQLEAALCVDELPLVRDLLSVGYPVNSVWDLVNSKSNYSKAIPVMIRHLGRPYHSKTREGIIRALTVPEARGSAAAALLRELRTGDVSDEQIRFALANALTVVADRTMTEDISELLSDPRYSDVHDLLAKVLDRIGS